MKEEILFGNLMAELRKRYPNNAQLTSRLVEILHIEREAVYRRLRGEVPFTFAEAAKIASRMEISLDEIIGARSPKLRPFQLRMIEYQQPREEDYRMISQLVEVLRGGRGEPDAEVCIASNFIPQALYIDFPLLTRFYIFKWIYMYSGETNPTPYADTVCDQMISKVQAEFGNECKLISNCSLLWDNFLFTYLANDIKYFRKIRLITPAECGELRAELHRIIEHIASLASRGSFGPGNKLNIYIYRRSTSTPTTATYPPATSSSVS